MWHGGLTVKDLDLRSQLAWNRGFESWYCQKKNELTIKSKLEIESSWQRVAPLGKALYTTCFTPPRRIGKLLRGISQSKCQYSASSPVAHLNEATWFWRFPDGSVIMAERFENVFESKRSMFDVGKRYIKSVYYYYYYYYYGLWHLRSRRTIRKLRIHEVSNGRPDESAWKWLQKKGF